jgi:hypothetical protein
MWSTCSASASGNGPIDRNRSTPARCRSGKRRSTSQLATGHGMSQSARESGRGLMYGRMSGRRNRAGCSLPLISSSARGNPQSTPNCGRSAHQTVRGWISRVVNGSLTPDGCNRLRIGTFAPGRRRSLLNWRAPARGTARRLMCVGTSGRPSRRGFFRRCRRPRPRHSSGRRFFRTLGSAIATMSGRAWTFVAMSLSLVMRGVRQRSIRLPARGCPSSSRSSSAARAPRNVRGWMFAIMSLIPATRGVNRRSTQSRARGRRHSAPSSVRCGAVTVRVSRCVATSGALSQDGYIRPARGRPPTNCGPRFSRMRRSAIASTAAHRSTFGDRKHQHSHGSALLLMPRSRPGRRSGRRTRPAIAAVSVHDSTSAVTSGCPSSDGRPRKSIAWSAPGQRFGRRRFGADNAPMPGARSMFTTTSGPHPSGAGSRWSWRRRSWRRPRATSFACGQTSARSRYDRMSAPFAFGLTMAPWSCR